MLFACWCFKGVGEGRQAGVCRGRACVKGEGKRCVEGQAGGGAKAQGQVGRLVKGCEKEGGMEGMILDKIIII